MNMKRYAEQAKGWPQEGNVILANYDETTITVYQAYRPAIGDFAVKNQYFDGEFKLSRMSWIKPNFLWMMYRSGWGEKPGQEVVLEIRMMREGFDSILREAVHSSFARAFYPDHMTHGRNASLNRTYVSNGILITRQPDRKKIDARFSSDFGAMPSRDTPVNGSSKLLTCRHS